VSRRVVAVALAVVVLVAAAGAGLVVWQAVRDAPPQRPEISAYSHGHLTRVGPYLYCDVKLTDCQYPQTLGELPVSARDPVQLSVPAAIGRAPWRLLRVYKNPEDTTEEVFRPDSRLAVTIPTVDPHRGRLTGVVVQLLTLALGPDGELAEVRHAEWSVRIVWP
jgi:hypothetical protein